MAGQASKVGKTSFVEKVVQNLCGEILAVKVAVSEGQKNPVVSIENNEQKNVQKDTGRFLKAGAKKAVYLKSNLENLGKTLDELESKINEKFDYVIYEGNNIINFINPIFIIYLKNDNLEKKYSADKASRKADIILDYSNKEKNIIFKKESMICYKAHLLADILGLSVGEIGKLLNKSGIKIKECQLGLF